MNREFKRLMIARLTPEFILGLIGSKCSYMVVGGGLPEDTVIQTYHHDFTHVCICVRLWSASFGIVPEGQAIPYLDVDIKITLAKKEDES